MYHRVYMYKYTLQMLVMTIRSIVCMLVFASMQTPKTAISDPEQPLKAGEPGTLHFPGKENNNS